jgi:hypothetical protein
LIPATRLKPAGSVTASNSRAWPGLEVNGEPVSIPKRIYNPEPPARTAAELSRAELLVLAGIYTRHHDGFVRQRWLARLLAADQAWAAPFVVQLLGEYVIDICHDIELFARAGTTEPKALHQHLSTFLADNRPFAALTSQRAISYWSCHYRNVHGSRDTYPALAALSTLGAGPRELTARTCLAWQTVTGRDPCQGSMCFTVQDRNQGRAFGTSVLRTADP